MSKHRHIVIDVPDTDYEVVDQYPDQYLSSVRVVPEAQDEPDPVPGKYGRVPFLDISAPRDRTGEPGEPGLPYGGFVTWSVRNQTFTDNPDNLYTRISRNNPATGNISVASRVTIAAGGFFRRNVGGINKTAIRDDVDLLQIVRQSGRVELYTIASIINDTEVQVNHYESGATASFDPSESLLITWIQPVFRAGDQTFEYRARPILGETTSGHRPMPGFFAGSVYRANSFPIGEKENIALQWGGFNERNGNTETNGTLLADGRLDCRLVNASVVSDVDFRFISTGSGTWYYNLTTGYDLTDPTTATSVHLRVLGNSAFNFNFSSEHDPRPGQRVTIVIEITGSYSFVLNFNNNLVINMKWLFSGSDAVLPPVGPGIYKFEGVTIQDGSGDYQMLMTRTDY